MKLIIVKAESLTLKNYNIIQKLIVSFISNGPTSEKLPSTH